MSLATLLRKTNAQQNISAHGFSSAGTIRGLSPTGKTYLNSTVRTPMRGTTARGYGGCCGTYARNILSGCCLDCPGTGVGNETNAAILQKKTRHLLWTADTQSLNYESHLRQVRVQNSCQAAWPRKPTKTPEEGCCSLARIGSKVINRSTYYHALPGAATAQEYTSTNLYRNKCLPPPPCKGSFPPPTNPTACGIQALTPEEAIRLGILPRDWGKCRGKWPGNTAFQSNPYKNA